MPYKSDAQRRFFHAAEARGDIAPSVVKEWDSATKGKKLPERKKEGNSMASKKCGDMHLGGADDSIISETGKHTTHGADGSHQDSHKSMKGARGRIHVGSPSELEKFHEKDEE